MAAARPASTPGRAGAGPGAGDRRGAAAASGADAGAGIGRRVAGARDRRGLDAADERIGLGRRRPLRSSSPPPAAPRRRRSSPDRPAPPPSRARRTKPAPEPSFIDSITSGNPLYLGLGALGLLALGYGAYRYTQRSKKDSGETSFLESRLQPDSFFGASGGQRIDTRDAAGSSSSMTYSLSQLDAIGDVDPVAEADVYLAYGRDLQAEEILKEAMRSNPERLAIRTKLLEVYAKRRDIKGFELLATQLFALTRGEGDDWAKAQELGAQIDPDNPMYRAGGAPERPLDGGEVAEPLGASTLPQSIIPVPSNFALVDGRVDAPRQRLRQHRPRPRQPRHRHAVAAGRARRDRVDPAAARGRAGGVQRDDAEDAARRQRGRRRAAADRRDEPLPFDLSGISLDLDQPVTVAEDPSTAPGGLDDGGDPLSRKLELAEEFQRIGDKDGARDLLREVLATASGATKTKAQGMLDRIS